MRQPDGQEGNAGDIVVFNQNETIALASIGDLVCIGLKETENKLEPDGFKSGIDKIRHILTKTLTTY